MKYFARCAAASLCLIAPSKALAAADPLYINIKPEQGLLVKSNGGPPIAIAFLGDLNGAGYSAECRVQQTGPNSIMHVPGGEQITVQGPVGYKGSGIAMNSKFENYTNTYAFSANGGTRLATMHLINKATKAMTSYVTVDGYNSWRPMESKAFTADAIMGTGKSLATDLCGALVQYYPTIASQFSKNMEPDQLCPKQPKGASREQTIKFCEDQTLGQYRTIGLIAPAQ